MPEETPNKSVAKEEKIPWKERIADFAVKAFMTLSVAGGGAGAFWSLFKESDIPKAIASGVIGVGLTYGASLLSPVHEGNQRRLGALGRWIDRSIDGGLEWLRWQVSGCDGKYLQRQGERCREYYGIDVEDFKQPEGILQVNLAEVFVPLNLDLSMGEFRKATEQADQKRSCEIWDFLAQEKRDSSFRWMAILAEGGSGKTTLMRHIGYEYFKGRHRKLKSRKLLPFLLYLRKWRDVIADNPEMTLPDLMVKHARSLRDGKNLKIPPNWAEDLLKAGKAIVMFDGYDEVAPQQRKPISEWISREVAQYPDAVFLMTSRPGGYEDFKEYAADVPTTLRVQEFEKADRDIFIRKWYLNQERLFRLNQLTSAAKAEVERQAVDLIEQIDASPELQKMSANPLQLNLIARVHKFAAGTPLPKQKTKLYQEIFDLQLGARPLAKRVEMVLDSTQERQQILQVVALEMLRQNLVQVERSQILDWVRSALASVDETVQAEAFLKEVVQVAELLYEATSEELAFTHLSFRNYLAALECLKQQNWEEVVAKFGEDSWRETILMLSGRLKPGVLYQLVQQACAANPKNVYLAYDCLVRYPNAEKIDSAWIDALQPLRYAKLERLMQAGKWQEADFETYRIMIQTCGKSAGESLTPKNFQEVSCWDLLQLDRLWVQYSVGKFGFSVQKKIWQECGSPITPGKEWDNLCVRVGWINSDLKYISYPYLKKNPFYSPIGELPALRGVCGVWWVFASLAQRPVDYSESRL